MLSLFLLALLLVVVGENGAEVFGLHAAALLIGKVVLFFAITISVEHFVFALLGKYLRHLHFPDEDFSMLLIGALACAIFAELMGLHFILGAFIAGMSFQPSELHVGVYDRVERQMSGITSGFLAPIFFVSVGMNLDVSTITRVPGFVAVLILVAFASKLIGSGLPAYWLGLSSRESMMVGVGMSGRGAVELIIAGIALEAGLFLQPQLTPAIVESLYSAIVLMALVTTVVTPIVLRWQSQVILADSTPAFLTNGKGQDGPSHSNHPLQTKKKAP